MRRFFADASHELRTPLASLRANAELYQQGALRGPGRGRRGDGPDRARDPADGPAGRRHAPAGPARPASRPVPEPVDVTGVVAGCAERVRVADPARAWRVRIAAGLTTTGDEELLRRAVDNLLMNVLVHTPRGTTGTITASAAGGYVRIEVSDEAPASRRTSCRTSSSASTGPGPGRAGPAPASGWPSPPRSRPRTAAPRRPPRQAARPADHADLPRAPAVGSAPGLVPREAAGFP